MALTWDKRPTQLDFVAYAEEVKAGVRQIARESALAMEGSAKGRAPWTDDTGAARSGLQGTVSGNASVATITLAHSAEYGQYLELRWPKGKPPANLDGFAIEFLEAGRYAIIWPTIAAEIPRLTAALRRLMGGA